MASFQDDLILNSLLKNACLVIGSSFFGEDEIHKIYDDKISPRFTRKSASNNGRRASITGMISHVVKRKHSLPVIERSIKNSSPSRKAVFRKASLQEHKLFGRQNKNAESCSPPISKDDIQVFRFDGDITKPVPSNGSKIFTPMERKISEEKLKDAFRKKSSEDSGFDQSMEDEAESKKRDTYNDKYISVPQVMNVEAGKSKGRKDSKSRSPLIGRRGTQKTKFNSNQPKEIVLLNAVANRDQKVLRKHLTSTEESLEVNFLFPSGGTVLHQAIIMGDLPCVSVLVQHGADITLETCSGLTPTLLAAQCGHFDIAQLLLLCGANVEDVRNGHQHLFKE